MIVFWEYFVIKYLLSYIGIRVLLADYYVLFFIVVYLFNIMGYIFIILDGYIYGKLLFLCKKIILLY